MDVADCLLDGNPDAVEFCPENSFHNVLAVSTYTLQEGDNPSRSGSISLFNIDADDGSMELIHRVETIGIFDIKWGPLGGTMVGRPLLGQADADGCVRIHALEIDENEAKGNYSLREINGENISSSSMCLCLDWNPSATAITVGLSNGTVAILSIAESQLKIQDEWKAHDFELWATSFDTHQPHLVYTGSDDCKFCCWDLRSNPSTLAFQNSKVHQMGICCITKSDDDPFKLLTGSYDEKLRVWDMRSISKPVNETSVCLGGGVWRIKYHPVVKDLVLAACMHNGFAIVKLKEGSGEVMESYKKHGSLAYGADWQRGEMYQEGQKRSTVIATCSFYDKLVRIWMPEIDIFT